MEKLILQCTKNFFIKILFKVLSFFIAKMFKFNSKTF